MRYNTLIFDCDGTLADTEIRHQEAIVMVLDESGFSGYDVAFCNEHLMGRGMTYVIDFLEKREGRKLPADFMERYIDTYLEIIKKGAIPVKGAVEAVSTLSKTHTICVASNGEPENVVTTIQSMGMLEFFGTEHIFTKSQVARGKPAPDLFLFAAEKMGATPKECIVIEDSMAGVQAGLAAGMLTIGITAAAHDPAFTAENMKKLGVPHIFNTWAEIVAFITAENERG